MRHGPFLVALSVTLALGMAAAALTAGEWRLSGSLAAEGRYFLEDPAFPGQLEDSQASLLLAPEWRWRSEDRRHQVKISPWGRWDGEDDERSHFDLREGYYRYVGKRWELLAGVNRIFWGVTESRHLVDIVNQTDAVEDIDNEDKLGQPMIQLAIDRDWGRLELLSLVGFRERTFPGRDGRLRAPLVVDTDAVRYESRAGDERIDWALRWTQPLSRYRPRAHLRAALGWRCAGPGVLLDYPVRRRPSTHPRSLVVEDRSYRSPRAERLLRCGGRGL